MILIGSIGLGLFIIIILWILALIVFVVGIKFQSNNVAWISLGSASVITLILTVIPLEIRDKTREDTFEEKDYRFIWSALLLSCLVIAALIGFIVFFVLHCIEPIHPRPVKQFIDS